MILAGALAAGPIIKPPLGVTGSGNFFTSFPGSSGWTISFGGSDGVNSVSIIYATSDPGAGIPPDGNITGAPFAGGFSATIDGTTFDPGFYSFHLGGGGASATGYDAQHNPVIVQQLIAFLQVTSYQCTGNPETSDCFGSFDVLPVPEPSSADAMLLGVGTLALLQAANVVRKRRSTATRS
jgi:hypothetical protein